MFGYWSQNYFSNTIKKQKKIYGHYLIWRGDVPVKKTLVLFGSMLLSTHFDHVLITLSYATGLGTSSYSVAPSSNDPRLLHHTKIHISFINLLKNHEILLIRKEIRYNVIIVVLTRLSYWKCSSTKCMY
jgi:hypothetical protein